MSLGLELVGLLLLFIWLSILTFLYYKLFAQYQHITKGSERRSVVSVVDTLLSDMDHVKKNLVELANRCDKIEKEEMLHIQKIGLLRFNPFKDTGGDQSFIVALVNAHDTGVVISGLYSRSGTRWYAKKVVEGKGFEHELSEEETKALKLAKAT
jgi:hypothetical protein